MLTQPGAPSREQLTKLLVDWRNGSREALEHLTPLVYDELHRLASRYLSNERNANTLAPTALINEAYLRLVNQNLPDFESRSHFFGVAAQLMRQILVDHARKHRSAKRGAGVVNVAIEDAIPMAPERSPDIVALDDALQALTRIDERKAKVIELRFFGGLSIEETATALGISVATVGREQRFAEAWLHNEISRSAAS